MTTGNTYDIVAEVVKKLWSETHKQDVVAFFEQKYNWDNHWYEIECIVRYNEDGDPCVMEFDWDFCEGQTDIRNLYVIPLTDVLKGYRSIFVGETW